MELAQQTQAAALRARTSRPGQTLIKTIIAPGLKARLLGVEGWYSTNILGNRDGEVLDDPGVVQDEGREQEVGARLHPAAAALSRTSTRTSATSSASTTTRRAATTRKAGTTSIWSAGSATRCSSRSTSSAATASWRRRSCSTWRCSSISRKRAGMYGIQEWLSFYFKSPVHAPGLYPEHDLFIQLMKLKNTLRYLKGEELITHLGREYYD